MKVSVTMPVCNVASYVEQAILSVLAQPETYELIVVEDGSRDDSLAICQRMAGRDTRIRVLQHPGGQNRGLAASRNVAIANATGDYIAFLDADDYYLPGRFATAATIFSSVPDAEGVCDAVGLVFEDKETKDRFNDPARALHTMPHVFAPNQLLELLVANKGWFHFNGIVVKREVMERAGTFDERVKTASVLGMEFKMAAAGRLYPGSLDRPVAMRRMYPHSITAKVARAADLRDNQMVFREAWDWARRTDLAPRQRMLFFLAACWGDALPYSHSRAPVRHVAKIMTFAINAIRHPSVLFCPSLWELVAARVARKSIGPPVAEANSHESPRS